MRRYETIFIIRPTVGEEDTNSIIARASTIISDGGGTVIKIDKWGLKKLAYLIKKENQGYYVYVDYAGLPAAVAEIERIFRIDDRILKYMTVKLADFCDPAKLLAEAAKKEAAKAVPDAPVTPESSPEPEAQAE